MSAILKAPFPWFGGKSRAAALVWAGFGDVSNYVEPFAGSLAVLLGRPTAPRVETVNDLDCYLANFWRAVKFAPDLVAEHADWPVNEADLHARHRWLVGQVDFRKRMKHEPKFFDAQIAGWWVWGICQWIGGGWCSTPDWEGRTNAGRKARGVNTAEENRRPNLGPSNGVHRKLGPGRERNLSNASEWAKRPVLGRGGRGVHLSEQIPNLSGDSGAAGRGVHASGQSQGPLLEWINNLAVRLRRVRVCCGDWKRILGRSSTENIGTTGVLLDPPYNSEAGRDPSLYACEDLDVSHRVREWALANGKNLKLRIALCGYEGEHEMPANWQCVPWKAAGGYAASAGNTENANRERIWFSPACESVGRQRDLFIAGATP